MGRAVPEGPAGGGEGGRGGQRPRCGQVFRAAGVREEEDGALLALQQFSMSGRSVKSEIKTWGTTWVSASCEGAFGKVKL